MKVLGQDLLPLFRAIPMQALAWQIGLTAHKSRMLQRSNFEKYFEERKYKLNVGGEPRSRKLELCDYVVMPFVGKG